MNNVIEQCDSCGAEGQAYNLVNGILTCSICHASMLKEKDMPIPINAPEGLAGTKTAIVGLSLSEMLENVNKARKEFETLEGRLNKVRQQKLNAVADDDRETVVVLSKEDTLLSQQLNSAYELWQTAKKNYEYSLADKENLILAEGKLNEHDSKVKERASSANIFLNMVAELNNQIALVNDAGKEFKDIQSAGLNDAERLVMDLKQRRISRIDKIDLQQLREDNYGAIMPIKQSLSREAALLENGLAKVEAIIANIRKGIYPSLLRRGD